MTFENNQSHSLVHEDSNFCLHTCAAAIKGVSIEFGTIVLALAPCASNNETMSSCPAYDAFNNAVQPCFVFASISHKADEIIAETTGSLLEPLVDEWTLTATAYKYS